MIDYFVLCLKKAKVPTHNWEEMGRGHCYGWIYIYVKVAVKFLTKQCPNVKESAPGSKSGSTIVKYIFLCCPIIRTKMREILYCGQIDGDREDVCAKMSRIICRGGEYICTKIRHVKT